MDKRWPKRVFASGEEPDYRFSFANERTFLAWVRTGVALVAGGVALYAIELSIPDIIQQVVASMLVVLGMICAAGAWFRWAAAELAMRLKKPLPSSRLLLVLPIVVIALSAVVVATL